MTRKLEAVREINIKVELQISKPGYSHLRNRLNKKHNLKDVAARGIPHQLFVFKGSWSFSKSYPAQVVLVAFRHSTLTNHHRVDQKKTSCQSGMAEVRNTSWKRSLLPAKRTRFEENRQTKPTNKAMGNQGQETLSSIQEFLSFPSILAEKDSHCGLQYITLW